MRALARLGFGLVREGASHSVFQHADDPSRMLVLPRHSRVKRLLLKRILQEAGVSEEGFMEHY